MNAPGTIRRDTPVVNATRFRQAHEEDWSRLEHIVTRMEKRSIRSLSEDDLLALPGLYRTTLSSLSVARDTSLDRRSSPISSGYPRALTSRFMVFRLRLGGS